MKELFHILFGEYSFVQVFGFMWFYIIGYLITALDETTDRDVSSPNTPKKWRWKFWFYDNWRRYVVTILATYILFRFYTEFTGNELTCFECVMIGLVGDGIGTFAKRRVMIAKVNRKKLMETNNFDMS